MTLTHAESVLCMRQEHYSHDELPNPQISFGSGVEEVGEPLEVVARLQR